MLKCQSSMTGLKGEKITCPWASFCNRLFDDQDCIYCGLLIEIHLFIIQPGVTLKHAKEGTESSAFWFALGGKQNYTSKKVSQEIVRDPHLFTFSFNKGHIPYS